MLDEITGTESPGGWRLPAGPWSPTPGYGDNTTFRRAWPSAGRPYVVAVKGTTSAPRRAPCRHRRPTGTGRRPRRPATGISPPSLRDRWPLGRTTCRYVTWRHGTKTTPANRTAAMRSRFLALRIRPANRDIPRGPDGTVPECWLLAEWPPGQPEPTDYWLSDLPADTPIAELVRLAKIRWRIEHDYRELKTGLGLDHFEGRS